MRLPESSGCATATAQLSKAETPKGSLNTVYKYYGGGPRLIGRHFPAALHTDLAQLGGDRSVPAPSSPAPCPSRTAGAAALAAVAAAARGAPRAAVRSSGRACDSAAGAGPRVKCGAL